MLGIIATLEKFTNSKPAKTLLNFGFCFEKEFTLKYLRKEHAPRLLFLEFLPTLLALFHAMNEKFAPLFTFFHVIRGRS